jgi:pSer/pThr/pTyr-binding forkhead associated (FHA) protein
MGQNNFRLTVIKGIHKGEEYPLDKNEVIIGRGEDNDIVFNIAEVSRTHCALTRTESGFVLKDLDSTNGTFVDKKKIGGKYLLKPGDTIMLGDAIYLTFQAETDPDATIVSPRPEFQQDLDSTAVTPKTELQKETREALIEEQPQPVSKLSEEQMAESGGRRTWLWAGIGCLVVVIFLAVVGLIVFDYLNLYCTPPFDSLLNFLYTCP